MAEQKKTFGNFKFAVDVTSPTIEIHQGEYRRVFKRDEQPFAATSIEEAAMLRHNDLFVEVAEAQTVDGGPQTVAATEPAQPVIADAQSAPESQGIASDEQGDAAKASKSRGKAPTV